MNGWIGKMLRVDLTAQTVKEEPLDPQAARDYIGGRGLGVYYLLKETDPKVDPLSPENMIVMATGPLTGTKAPTGARYMVVTKSPLTGAITCSNSGGHFPTQLKKAGYDGIIVTGRAKTPVYLWIEDGRAELRPADHLWGKDTHQTDDTIKEETDRRAKVASIGPAGERGALFASIMNDRDRAAGRSGVGAVMGSKNLKAVAVRGRGTIPLADPEKFDAEVKAVVDPFKEAAKENPPALRAYGTPYVVMVTNSFGVLPTRNWKEGTFENWKEIHGEKLTEKFLVRNVACHACPLACGRGTKVDVPGYEGEGEGPEYETVYAMGSNCGIDNLAAITKANYICNELGLDTISMGATLACAMELAEEGVLPQEDVGLGRPLRFGDADALVELSRQTGLLEGFGKELAQGSRRLAEKYGRPELSISVKSQEPAGYEPRGAQGMGLAYATSPIGASHMRGDPAYFELFGTPVKMDAQTTEGKAPVVAAWQDLSAIVDAAGLCIFVAARLLVEPELTAPPEGIRKLLHAATGQYEKLDELIQAGRRIINAERVWLNRAGFDRAQDTLPDRLTKEPMPDGPAKGQVCRLDEMLDEYYQCRGWTAEGKPLPETLEELDIRY
jgi:aldehyde:ferredoxin oxidoreductase